MGERSGVLGKLCRAQRPRVGDALDGARTLIGGEFLVAKDGQSLFQTELEPVATGDAVSGPIVEIFVCDDRLDTGIIDIGSGLRQGEHIFVVEYVEPLVLHRAHVEVRHSDDIEDVEIIFAPERLFVPGHRPLQRIECIGGACFLTVLDIDRKIDLAARYRDELVPDRTEIAADEGEEVARFGMGVVPDREMPRRPGNFAFINLVAVAEQHRNFHPLGLDARCINRQHVGPVEKIGDAAKSFGLALRAIG